MVFSFLSVPLAPFPKVHPVALSDVSAQHLLLPCTQAAKANSKTPTVQVQLQLTLVSATRLQRDSVSLITVPHISRTSLFTPNIPHNIQQYRRKKDRN